MATNNVSLTSLINPLDPSSATSAYQVQRQQALAQALQQQAFQPMDEGKVVSGGWYAPPSKLAGINKIAQTLLGIYAGKQADQNAGDLQKSNMESMIKALSPSGATQPVDPSVAAPAALQMGAASGSVGPTVQNAQTMDGMTAPAPGSTGSALNPLGMNAPLAARLLMTDPSKYYETQAGAYKQADIVAKLRAAGVDPNSDQGRQMALTSLQKDSYIAPVNAREGSTVLDPHTLKPIFNAPNKEGIQYNFDANGNPSANVVPGFANALSQFEQARLQGKNKETIAPKDILPTNPDGTVNPVTVDNTIHGNGGFPAGTALPAPTQSGTLKQGQNDRLTLLQNELAGERNPDNIAALQREIAREQQREQQTRGVGAPYGLQANADAIAKGQVSTMQDSYKSLQGLRSGAPMALQDIGHMIDLASGKSPLVAGDTATKMAGLVSSNAAEYEKSRDNLVTNLGSQLGMGTDAARALVYGSVPAYGAPKQAIANGLKTLQGQVQMRMQKADYLSNAYGSGDPKKYNSLENQFDQNVTPSLAGIASMPSGPERAAMLKQAAGNPQLRAKLEWMAQNGILK